MIGILVVTHGEMSSGIMDAANLIFGEVENLETLSLFPEDNVADLKDKILNAYEKTDQGDGVIVLTDLMSASPFNQATMAINNLPDDKQEDTFVLTGVNLPMILEAINQNLIGANIEEAVNAIEGAGRDGIVKWSMSDVSVEEDDDF